MTTFDSPTDPMSPSAQKTSGLAIASLVCSLICCIPPIPLVASLLGILAMISIGSDPAKRGKGMAITGIVLGVLFTIGQAAIYPGVYGYVKETMALVTLGPSDVLVAGSAGDTAGFKAGFHGDGATAPDAEVIAFIAVLEDRYGEFVACRYDDEAGRASQPAFGTPVMPFPYVIEFTQADVKAEAEIVFSDPARGGFVNKIGSITIFDEDLGDVTFPAAGVSEVIEEVGEAMEEAGEAIEAIEETDVPEPGEGDGSADEP
jgi:hypothetical protein